ncbi:phosphoadenosine phosphosulfate reductase domain-containing protein, partial [Cetobacterium sp.]|uniref:phosphoadenosine phosphosulfate reductase domain-containing protein n=1 Tax=Cetobacterium sp. TaxID=2071632 RepID=UPI003F32007F
KQTSTTLMKLREQNLSEKYRNKLLYGDEKGNAGKLPEKYKHLLGEVGFKISPKCCDELKKKPSKKWRKENKILCVITREMAGESLLRKKEYLKTGCNAFDNNEPKSKPLGFWKEEDIWEYIKINNLEISECYTKFKMKRTGCYGCLFGCHIEERTGNNRIVELMDSHPHLYRYLMETLNYKHIMKTLGLRTYKIDQQKLFEEE